MSSNKPKRPSTARRNIKHETFSAFVSCSRLRQVQSLLSTNSSNKPDAILCITGIDSRYNEGTRELVNYLLFGFFDIRRSELEKSGFAEEVVDDLIFLIKPDSVDVYCNPINYHYLLPYIAPWRNINFHCLTDEEYEDQEGAEDFKIQSFINIAQGCSMIGIPSSSVCHPQDFDKFVVEKWPLIQAYAFDEYGGHGFFTLKHEVMDLSKEIHYLYSIMDPVSLETLVGQQLPLFERHWENMMKKVDMELAKEGADLLESCVEEALKSYFHHGRVGLPSEFSSRFPFVVFGNNSRQVALEKVLQNGNDSKDTLQSTGPPGSSAKMMVCQSVQPRGPLCCARTFFCINSSSHAGPDGDAVFDRDHRNLVEIYKAVVDAVITSVDTYVKTASVVQARVDAYSTFRSKCRKNTDERLKSILQDSSRLYYNIEACDIWGRHSSLAENERKQMVKTVTMIVYDVPSSAHKNQILGSVVFAESFLDSSVIIQQTDGQTDANCDVIFLTQNIPRISVWNVNTGNTTNLKSRIQVQNCDGLGNQIANGAEVDISSLCPCLTPPVKGHLFAFEYGIILSFLSCDVVLKKPELLSVQLFDGDSISEVATLQIQYSTASIKKIPPFLHSAENQLLLIFPPKSKAHKLLYSEVLHQWKSNKESPVVERVDRLGEHNMDLHHSIQTHCSIEREVSAGKNVSTLHKASSSIPKLERFLDHFCVSSVGNAPLPENHVPLVLNATTDSIMDEEVIISVLTGIPGNNVENLCLALKGVIKNDNRWIIVHNQFDVNLDKTKLQNQICKAVTTLRDRPLAISTGEKQRILLVTPGLSDTREVINIVQNHSKKELSMDCKIGAVTVCIDPQNTFLEHRLTYPVLLSHCAQGWVNNIVFTSCTKEPSSQLETIQKLIRCVNTDVALLLAENGEVTRSTDIDLILSETAFSQKEHVRARHLLTPGWWIEKAKEDSGLKLNAVTLSFSQALVKQQFFNLLKDLKQSLQPYPFSGNIYYLVGRVRFAESGKLFDVSYATLAQNMNIRQTETEETDDITLIHSGKGDANTVCHMTFCGFKLTKEMCMNLLRKCSKTKPEKKKHISRKDLTRKDIETIHGQHHLDTLPAGWFYNGTNFVSFSGEKTDRHPNLEEFVKEHLDMKNVEIDQFNEQIDLEEYRDMFEL